MAKKKRRGGGKIYRPISQRYLEKMYEIEELMNRGQWVKAREMLESLNRKYTNRPEVLTHLVNVSIELQDMEDYQRYCEQLHKITPDDPDVMAGLAGGYLTNLRPALALQTYRRFLDRWPDHERADDVRKIVDGLEQKAQDMMARIGLTGDDAFEISAMHEEINSLLSQGKYAQVRKLAEQLLERKPDFAPALNNLSLAHFIEGRIADAIAAERRVLEFDPNNIHALSNLARFLCLSGQAEEATQIADRLKAVESTVLDSWIKKGEAFSYLGDDEAVLDCFRDAEREGELEGSPNPFIYHLAAVAAMRLGRDKEALRRWQKALDISPGFRLAQENLDDLSKPVGERHAPWAFDFTSWVPRKTIGDLLAYMRAMPKRGKEAATKSAVNRFLREHPEIEPLVPILLDRGDAHAREFALRVASQVKTPAMLEALRDYALSQRGPDAVRHRAAQVVSEEGLLPAGLVRLWWQGEWRELMLLNFQITGEPTSHHHPKVERLLIQALSHLHEEDGEQAERLLKQALEIEPDSPTLMNNLAMAYLLQDRDEEALELTREANRRHPDYVFAAVTLAHEAIKNDQVEEAETLLHPLLLKRRFHYSELAAFCEAEVALMIARDKPDGARSWLGIWEQADPDNPRLIMWKRRLSKSDLRGRLFGRD